MPSLRRVVPPSIKRGISAALARVDHAGLDRALRALAAGDRPIIAGPWLGEVGFELLYWVPFVNWFADRYHVDRARLTVVSRGGTASWYGGAARGYRDVLDYVTPEEFKAQHDARVREAGEQKQTRMTGFEERLLDRVRHDEGVRGAGVLHPALMYRVLRRFWWGHLDERWVHRHTVYRTLPPIDDTRLAALPASYVAVKFYFNDCFPASAANRAFVRRVVGELAAEHPVVSLWSGADLDDHGRDDSRTAGVIEMPGPVAASQNLHLQCAIVARASAFVGTYGGFAYLAPFYGVRSLSYYDDPHGFARSHLRMARSALAVIGRSDLLEVRPTAGGAGERETTEAAARPAVAARREARVGTR